MENEDIQGYIREQEEFLKKLDMDRRKLKEKIDTEEAAAYQAATSSDPYYKSMRTNSQYQTSQDTQQDPTIQPHIPTESI